MHDIVGANRLAVEPVLVGSEKDHFGIHWRYPHIPSDGSAQSTYEDSINTLMTIQDTDGDGGISLWLIPEVTDDLIGIQANHVE